MSAQYDDLLDSRIVSTVVAAINDNRIFPAIQGVHDIGDIDEIFYGECLARMIAPDGTIKAALEFVPALELLGQAPVLDRYMLSRVLNRLEADPRAVLGCNISADNLNSHRNWDGILGQIADCPHLAPRLVLEITETRPLGNLAGANDLLKKVRNLGCRIAIDDFGTGFFAPDQLLGIEVDIIKIDSTFLDAARFNQKMKAALNHGIAWAGCFAPYVIAEGVETEKHLELAREAGVTHAQGYLLSLPSQSPAPFTGMTASQ